MDNYIYTDLALENSSMSRMGKSESVFVEMGIKIIKTTFDSQKQNGFLPRDLYYTVDCDNLAYIDEDKLLCVSQIVASKLREISKKSELYKNPLSVLVIGLGNRNICADSLGVLACDYINVLDGKNSSVKLSLIQTGVNGQTGISTSKLCSSVAKLTEADIVICIDALCARDPTRLGKVIQIGTCGIAPGSAILKKRDEISYSTVNAPVISIGIPTVISAQALINSFLHTDNYDYEDFESIANLYVTPSDCDIIIKNGAYIISDAINRAFSAYLS